MKRGRNMKHAYKTSGRILLAIILFLLASLTTTAFGIVMPYWEGRPLTMHPAETKDVSLKLQNVGGDDLKLEVTLTQGSEIAKITDKSLVYEVPKGNTDTKINMRVSIPENDPVGKEYKIGISIKDISSKGAGMVQLTNTIDKTFDVVVETRSAIPKDGAVEMPKPAKDNNLWLTVVIVLAILAIIAIALLFFARKQERQPKRKTNFK